MSYNPCGAKPLTPEQAAAGRAWTQGILTGIGLVPVVGEFADGFSALICLGEGDMSCVGLGVASMAPIGGWAAAGAKGVKVVDDIARTSSAASRVTAPLWTATLAARARKTR